MDSNSIKTVGIVGSGSFGMAVASLLSYNTNVFVLLEKMK